MDEISPPTNENAIMVFSHGLADQLLRAMYRNDGGECTAGTLNSTQALSAFIARKMMDGGWVKSDD